MPNSLNHASFRLHPASLLRRAILGLLLLGAAALLIFGPRSEGEHPADPSFTVIQYWEKWTGNEGEQLKQIVDLFNKTTGKQKKIFVQLLTQSEIDKKTLMATANGVPPDVAGLWDKQLPQFAALDALEPLDDLAAAHGINESYYKRVYWNACKYEGKLYGLVSTPATMALHYNKRIFQENADKLRAAGLDPYRAPRNIAELDRYAQALDEWDGAKGSGRLRRAGYLHIEPGWYIDVSLIWFGGEPYDEAHRRLLLDSPQSIAAFDWVRSYSLRLGEDAMQRFKGGLGNFDSPQNAFLAGQVAMEQQGAWMANFIENRMPSMNRWGVSEEELKRERRFAEIKPGMSLAKVEELLGPPASAKIWKAGPSQLTLEFENNLVTTVTPGLRPVAERRKICEWAAAPFPSSDGRPNVTYAQFDVLVIPRGARHVKEAFEFIAFVNRQDISEKLCSMHCKDSPLANVSRAFIENHPNPYIEVFEELANSPNARAVPPVPTWPAVSDEMGVASEAVYTLRQTPEQALHDAQRRKQAELDRFFEVNDKRRKRE